MTEKPKTAAEFIAAGRAAGADALGVANDPEWPTPYREGVRLLFKGTSIKGTVIPNFKFAGDICVRWDDDKGVSSYDADFLAEHVEIIP